MPDPHHPGATSDSLFASWVRRREAGEEADLEAICREYPHAAAELRDLHDQWAKVEDLRRRAGVSGSLSEKLKTHYGSGVPHQVELEGEEPVKGDFSSGVLARLADRGPASTRYRVKGEVAHGGMGAVLRVWDEDLRRHLAMKVMLGKGLPREHGDTPKVDQRMLARFLEEAQVTGQLDHPGIVPVHELGLDAQGRVYFTMKLVRGKTLKDVFDELAQGQSSWTQTRVVGLILKICEAMSYAHSKGVIHRDLKPANIMVGRYGEVFVMDWGLAKIIGREDGRDIRPRAGARLTTSEVRSARHDREEETADRSLLTMDGDVVGTPAYMPPEQAAGDVAAMGPHSDVYAVGAMLYHLLAGHMPYVPAGARLNNHAVWCLVQVSPPPSLHALRPRLPAELVAICERAMAREVPDRYANMSALAEDLSAYIEGRVVAAYETGAWAETRKWVQRNRSLATSLAAAVALLVVRLVSSLALKSQSDAHAARADAKAQEAARNAESAQANLVSARKSEQEARENLALARKNEVEATEQRLLAEAETAKVLRLSDVKVLQELQDQADDLWPAYPDKIAELESWLVAARELVDRLPDHRDTLAEMRSRAQPWTEHERRRDRETHPRALELTGKRTELEGLITRLEAEPQADPREEAQVRLAELESEVAALTLEVSSRRTWTFESPEDQWQHDVLAELVGNLVGFRDGLLADEAITDAGGWSVPKRLEFALDLARGSADGGEYARAWNQALPAIRELYSGLDLAPQPGLVPIGSDPRSGLWEFAHLMSGAPAERDSDGSLALTEETGVVLVLLPGGSCWMGAQAEDPEGRNYDLLAQDDEGPVHEVELSAFFLSKCEMTQGQWLRLSGRNPSYYRTSRLAPTLLHPVEQISWLDCMEWLPRADLSLPSEAQWEYAARAGTDTPWWTGVERDSLREQHAANLADQAAARAGASWADVGAWPELDDGYAVHAAVGSFAANGFGLHDVAGNLWEWCLDGYDPDFYERSPLRDPVSPWDGAATRVPRGGCFGNAASQARSAARATLTPAITDDFLGVRPARAVEP